MEEFLGLKVHKVLIKGAEADIYLVDFFGQKAIIKYRKPKPYRNSVLDLLLRSERTILEAKLITRASTIGVNTPLIYSVSKPNASILMEYIDGITLVESDKEDLINQAKVIGRILGTLHNNGIIHGDPTLANMIASNKKIFLIDFGLGEFSYDLEQRAVDVNLFLRTCESLKPNVYDSVYSFFREGYLEVMGKIVAGKVLERVEQIRKRGRYIEERRTRN
jgi:TP53 regulating kinase-like protein